MTKKPKNPRAWHLLTRYGITEEQYDELFERQGGNCGVCGRHHKVFKIRLSVDHNHKTGEIRGLLCTHCNRYVIGRHREPDLFRRAADYLSGGTGWIVPERRKKRKKRRRKK